MATVIFSNMGDTDTAVLRYIWKGIPNVKVVEITKKTANAVELVTSAIEKEHDTLIMCGHGTPQGLLNPAGMFSGKDGYLINAKNKDKIRCNRVIGVWCHAKDFAERQGLRGFWSSMFISNRGEAMMNGINTVSSKSITEQEILFCVRLNELITNFVPMKNWIPSLRNDADYTNPVVKFNYDGLRYYKTAPKVKDYTQESWYKNFMASEKQRWSVDIDDVDNFLEYVDGKYVDGQTGKKVVDA